jgi:HSP20 family protein
MSMLTRWDPLRTPRWDPFKELEEMQKRMETALGRVPMRLRGGEREESLTTTEWAPAVDILEDDKEYVIKAEVPEINRENLKVSVQDDTLTLSGERRMEKEEKGKKYHRVERAYGCFMRSFTLPDDADGSKVTAEFKDGVLRVHLPKAEKARPKAIEVRIA